MEHTLVGSAIDPVDGTWKYVDNAGRFVEGGIGLPGVTVRGKRKNVAEPLDKVMLGTLLTGASVPAIDAALPAIATVGNSINSAADAAYGTMAANKMGLGIIKGVEAALPIVDAAMTSGFGAHGLQDVFSGNADGWTALEVAPLGRVGKAVLKEAPALIKDFNYWNPESMINQNIRINYANEKVPIGYHWKDPKNITPALKGVKQTLTGDHVSLLPLEDVVARDYTNTLKSEPFIRNSHIGFRKYLGLEDENILHSLETEQPLSTYIPKGDGSYYVNLGDEEIKALLANFSRNKGKGLYDTALGSHGGMNASLDNGVLHFEDVLDYHPFHSYKKLPKFIRNFEPSTIIPGAHPFKWTGDIQINHYIDPNKYEKAIKQGLGNGPLIKEATGKAYLPISEEESNARISKIIEDFRKSRPLKLK